MQTFLIHWAVAFVALIVAIPITAIIYQMMGDGLELNSWPVETITALAVSAGQAAGHLLHRAYLMPMSNGGGGAYSFKVDAVIFTLSFAIGYGITHLTVWDSLEYMILGITDAVLIAAAMLIFSRALLS